MTAASKRDAKLRDMPDGYVDPARGRKKHKTVRRVKQERKARERAKLAPLTEEEEREFEPRDPLLPPHQRQGIMFLALQKSVAVAAQECEVSEGTIYKWFKEEGGIEAIRGYVVSKAEVSFYKMLDATAQRLLDTIKDATPEELQERFLKMLETADRAGLSVAGGRKGRRGESADSPEHPDKTPPVTLVFNPPALPDKKDEGKEASPPKDEDTVDGEVINVFE